MGIQMKKVTDASFKQYGRVLTKEYDLKDILTEMGNTPCPSDVIYVPSDDKLEALPIMATMQNGVYGGLPIQIGYCNGHNHLLNAVEYHRSSEIDIAQTDLILLLGKQQDIEEDYTYDTNKIEAFFVPAGEMVELYGTTLHYAPCGVGENGFRCVIILPKGTNLEVVNVPKGAKEDEYMTAQNKWLIAHKDANIPGAVCGLQGQNISVL